MPQTSPAAVAASLALFFAAGCAGEPFGYAEDRCYGAHNQCQAACADLRDGPARAACQERCYAQETQCYATGDAETGSSLAEQSLIRDLRSRRDKEAAFQRWKAAKERERAEADAQAEAEAQADAAPAPQETESPQE
ncbi:hypothetical protein [Amphiplicatus metriothermophilus]|uniref:Uncharacterized protein n=1 Tax=Amphiplicatus metriothermophilus TaxID=1519374 RepID=A0A239PZL0_9PROT|nr:hypothetical protein [Amphiplicatus metriothermophilus]MBB5519842.1 hypothetical protein [Amphiplicatus metriothermophilus]SNT75107.1 hypothetical protein SAMN06297382_2549 [Amphiplicatus metriothermophilus]